MMLALVADRGGVRLDKWLAERFPQVSRQRWQEWIEAGGVQVNGAHVKPAYKLRPGDRVVGTLPPDRPPDIDLRPEPIPIEIVYEDAHLLVVNKPCGLTVHPAPGHPHGTLVNALLAYAPRLSQGSAPFRPGIVHRLDKDTSGLLIVARTDQAHARLAADLQRRAIERRYLALVWGEPRWGAARGGVAHWSPPCGAQAHVRVPTRKCASLGTGSAHAFYGASAMARLRAAGGEAGHGTHPSGARACQRDRASDSRRPPLWG
jgi:RluA family pseudouridine synthase